MGYEMKGDELQSLLKSSVHFKSTDGVRCDSLKLSEEDIEWWLDAKIGMFFHWGLYSILGRGEWAFYNEKIDKDEYRALADQFNPQDFEMKELVDTAVQLGAKYMVMVTRHHDGFALWDSPGSYEGFTSFNTSSKRDFVKEYSDACREAGLRVGLYYSPMDWRFPGYFDPKGLLENAMLMKEQCYRQVEELCSGYGKVDILWYDGGWLSHKGTDADGAWLWEPIKLNTIAREYNPNMLINPRSGLEGDFQCDEGTHKIAGSIIKTPWEKCMSITRGWSWYNDDYCMSCEEIIRMIVDVVCRGGNILLNVGPDRNGKLSQNVIDTMGKVGEWLEENGESIYGTRAGIFEPVDGIYGSTHRNECVYLHILDIDGFRGMRIPDCGVQVVECSEISGKPIDFSQIDGELKISISDCVSNVYDFVVRIKTA